MVLAVALLAEMLNYSTVSHYLLKSFVQLLFVEKKFIPYLFFP